MSNRARPQGSFMMKNFKLNDNFSTAYFANNAANRWLGVSTQVLNLRTITLQ
jgi:hypothetical protein